MSELASDGFEHEDPQRLFTEYSQQYFGGRLAPYKVLLTNDHSRCERRKRRIYINRQGEDLSVVLLHEMVHAAKGGGHSKVWLDEVRRLVDLGAPLQEELKRYAPENQETPKQLLGEFFEAGLYAPDWNWSEVRRYLGYERGITDKHGRAISPRWSRYLRRARHEWSKGRALANS